MASFTQQITPHSQPQQSQNQNQNKVATVGTGISRTFLLIIEVLPSQGGIDLARYIHKIDAILANYSTATSITYKFKVSGESKVLSVIKCVNIIGFERTNAALWRLGGVKVECFPIIPYESFAQTLKVPEHLTKPNSGTLSKEGLYWMEFDIEHPGRSTEELLNLWRTEADFVLSSRYKEGSSFEVYKVVAQKKVHLFINADSPDQIDLLSFKLPLMQENGAHVKINCKALQYLEDFTSRINSATEQM